MRDFLGFSIIWLLAASAAHAATPLDERPWIELKTENFVVRGVQSEKKLLDVARHAELLRAAAAMLMNAEPPESTVPTTVYVLPEREYREIFGHNYMSGSFADSPRERLIVIRGSAAVAEDKTVQFLVIAEQLYTATAFNYPAWYIRGLADYFAGSEILVESLSVGAPIQYQTNYLMNRPWISIEEWLNSGSYANLSEDGQYAFTAQSWILIHYLHHAKDKPVSINDGLRQFILARQAGRSEVDSFAHAFKLNPDDLRQILKRYMRRECCSYYRIPLELLLPELTHEVLELQRAEAALSMAQIALRRGNIQRAERWLDVAMNDPSTRMRALGLAALAAESDGRRQDAETRYADAAGLIQDDPEAGLDFATLKLQQASSSDGDDRMAHIALARELLDSAVDAGATGPEVYALAGRAHLMSGDFEQAIESLRQAAQMRPSYMEYRLLLAQAYSESGQQDEAYRLAQSLLYRTDVSQKNLDAAREIVETIGKQRNERSGTN